MTLPASIDITTGFNLKSSPYKFNLKNNTPFGTEGITLSNVKGNFKIVNPVGTEVWNNTSLVTPDLYSFSVSSINRSGTTATVVTSASHGLLTGDYVTIAGAVQTDYNGTFLITRINSTTFTYTVSGSPVAPATGTILGLKETLNTVSIPLDQATGYPIQGTYTITITLTIAGGVQAGTYEVPFIYTYSYNRPSVNIQQSLDCKLPMFMSIDASTYMQLGINPTITRIQQISFPAESGLSNESFVTQVVQIYAPKVWNGIYVTTLNSQLSYTFEDDLVVLDTITGSQAFPASCDINLCKINCCLNELNQNYINASGTDNFAAEGYLKTLNRALQLKALYEANIDCGNPNQAQSNLDQIYLITGCTGDCGCSDNTGQIIPYSGYIGKTILEWDDEIANSQGDYINFNNYLYHVLEVTEVGESPDTNPEKYQIIGFPPFDISNAITGSVAGVEMEGLTGVITFSDGNIDPSSLQQAVVNNELFLPTSVIEWGIIYDANVDPGIPMALSCKSGTGSASFYIGNFDTSTPVGAYTIWIRINN